MDNIKEYYEKLNELAKGEPIWVFIFSWLLSTLSIGLPLSWLSNFPPPELKFLTDNGFKIAFFFGLVFSVWGYFNLRGKDNTLIFIGRNTILFPLIGMSVIFLLFILINLFSSGNKTISEVEELIATADLNETQKRRIMDMLAQQNFVTEDDLKEMKLNEEQINYIKNALGNYFVTETEAKEIAQEQIFIRETQHAEETQIAWSATATIEAAVTPPVSEMVKIPPSELWIGNVHDPNADFSPAHRVFVSEFYIDKFEVSIKNYMLCVQAGKCESPNYIVNDGYLYYFEDTQYLNFPVFLVNWVNAQSYCQWIGARLPTEVEWEKAAKWSAETSASNLFPWGFLPPNSKFANFNSGGPKPIGSFPEGKTLSGIFDLAGNVFEWVSDNYSASFYEVSPKNDPVGPETSMGDRVARGGAWTSKENSDLWTFKRYHFPEDETLPDLGFRCAKTSP